MQVEVDVKCMQSNFGGHGLYVVSNILSPFCLISKWPKFPFRPWTIIFLCMYCLQIVMQLLFTHAINITICDAYNFQPTPIENSTLTTANIDTLDNFKLLMSFDLKITTELMSSRKNTIMNNKYNNNYN